MNKSELQKRKRIIEKLFTKAPLYMWMTDGGAFFPYFTNWVEQFGDTGFNTLRELTEPNCLPVHIRKRLNGLKEGTMLKVSHLSASSNIYIRKLGHGEAMELKEQYELIFAIQDKTEELKKRAKKSKINFLTNAYNFTRADY